MSRYVWVLVVAVLMGCGNQPASEKGQVLDGLSDSTKTWVEQLRSDDPELRGRAAEQLSTLEDEGLLNALLGLAQDEREAAQVRMDAIDLIGDRGDPKAVPPLLNMLERDLHERTGIWAALIPALGGLGDAAAVPLLKVALTKRDDDWLGREMAARALGEIGAPDAVPALISAAMMVDTRADALCALAEIQDPRAAQVLLSALDSEEDPEVRDVAKRGLVAMGVEILGVMKQAVEERYLSQGNQGDTLRAMLDVVAEIGGDSAGSMLCAWIDHSNPRLAREAQLALDRHEDLGHPCMEHP